MCRGGGGGAGKTVYIGGDWKHVHILLRRKDQYESKQRA